MEDKNFIAGATGILPVTPRVEQTTDSENDDGHIEIPYNQATMVNRVPDNEENYADKLLKQKLTDDEYERRRQEFIKGIKDNKNNLNGKYYEIIEDDFKEIDKTKYKNKDNFPSIWGVECLKPEYVKVYRIRALDYINPSDCDIIEKGDLGGYIEKEENLVHNLSSWIDKDSIVCGDSIIESSVVRKSAVVDSVIKYCVIKNSTITDSNLNKYHIESSTIKKSKIKRKDENDLIIALGTISRKYILSSTIENSKIKDSSIIHSYTCDSKIYNCRIENVEADDSTIKEYLKNAILKYAKIKYENDCISFSNVGSENGTLTAYIGKDNIIRVTRGCFTGTLYQFKQRVKEVHKEGRVYEEYMAIIKVIKLRLIHWRGKK